MAFKITKSNTGTPEDEKKYEIMIESSSDLTDLPEDAAPGSIAYTAGLSAMYQKGLDGTWVQIGA